jgi:UDP-glucuronate 4-epimerase
MKTVFLTGAAGFIGSKTADILLKQNYRVVGVDNMNTYYDVRLKNHRLSSLKKRPNFVFYKADIENAGALNTIFGKYKFDAVLNLAARAGVRYSLINPHVYFTTNTLGTLNLLELCKTRKIKKFVLASTSSLYAGQKMPFRETLAVNTPISPYAASKKAAELTCYTYNFHYGIDVTVVRYFTVYGPAGRPDMSVFRFIKWIDENQPLDLFGDGLQSRDFTYIDDIAAGTVKAMKKTGFEIINLGGGNKPYTLNHVIALIEKYLGKKAKIKTFAFPKADIKETWADITKAKTILGWSPTVSLEEGIKRSVDWYLENKNWLKGVKL